MHFAWLSPLAVLLAEPMMARDGFVDIYIITFLAGESNSLRGFQACKHDLRRTAQKRRKPLLFWLNPNKFLPFCLAQAWRAS
jgi:hypothetical protein